MHKLFIVLLILMTSAGCSVAPDISIVEKAITQKHSSIELGVYEIQDVQVLNEYTRNIRNETVYFVDYSATVAPSSQLDSATTYMHNMRPETINGTVSFVLRGEYWYSYP